MRSCAPILALLVLLGWSLNSTAQVAEWVALEDELDWARKEVDLIETVRRSRDSLVHLSEEIELSRELMDRFIPEQPKVDEYVLALRLLAEHGKLSIEVTPYEVVPNELYVECRFSVTAIGPDHAIALFLDRAQSFSRVSTWQQAGNMDGGATFQVAILAAPRQSIVLRECRVPSVDSSADQDRIRELNDLCAAIGRAESERLLFRQTEASRNRLNLLAALVQEARSSRIVYRP